MTHARRAQPQRHLLLASVVALATGPGCLPTKQICVGDCQASETFATGEPSDSSTTTAGPGSSSGSSGLDTSDSGSTSGAGESTEASTSTETRGSEGTSDGTSTGGTSLGHSVEIIDPACTDNCPPGKTLAWSQTFRSSSSDGYIALAQPSAPDGIRFYVATAQDQEAADRTRLWVLAFDDLGNVVKDYLRHAPGSGGVHVKDLTVAPDGSVWGGGIFGHHGDLEYDPFEWIFHLGPDLELIAVEENPPLAGPGDGITASDQGLFVGSNGVNQHRLVALSADGRSVLWNLEVEIWINRLVHSDDGHLYVVGRADSFRPAIVKYTTIGNLVWQREFDETENGGWEDVALTADGRIVVGGTDFSPGAGEQNILLAVYHPDGTPHWSRTLDSEGWDLGAAVAVGPMDEVLIAGNARPEGASHGYAFLRAYDPLGQMLWTEAFAEAEPKLSDVAYGADGSVLVAGHVDHGPDGDETNHHLVRMYRP